MMQGRGAVLTVVCLLIGAALPQLSAHGQKYVWRNVAIGGCGYITGVVTSPAERDLVYIRTDNGGAYRFQAATATWLPLMDVLPYADRDLYGIESIAVDPTNADVVYAACGKYTAQTSPDGDILKSTDKGRTWQKAFTGLKVGGDEDLRWVGERLAVDPANPSILYFGSRTDGLWRSENASASGSWSRLYSLTESGNVGTGLTFVTVDKRSASGGRSQKIYVGSYGKGVYLSTNAGGSWAQVWNDTKPMRCAIAVDGTAFITSGNGMLGIYNGTLRIARPGAKPALCAVAVHPADARTVIVGSWGWGQEEIYRTTDAGVSWSSINAFKISKGPTFTASFHDKDRFGSGMSALAIDPFNPDRVWMTEGLLAWRTDSIAATAGSWDIFVKGIEQTVVTDLISPSTGAGLISGLADVAGFRHLSILTPPAVSFNTPFVQEATTGLDCAGSNQAVVVRVGGFNGRSVGAFSEDNARTWAPFPTRPANANEGQVAVSADGSAWVWASTAAGGIFRTLDKGKTWQRSTGGPGSQNLGTRSISRLIADRVDPNLFYINDRSALYRSADKAASWQRLGVVLEHLDWRRCELQTVPGRKDEIWRSVESRGLFRSTNRGESFTKIASVQSCLSFGFGKPAPWAAFPAVYVMGLTGGAPGMYRSDNFGTAWVRIGGDYPTLGCFPGQVTGDMQVYGRVYVGSSGRGIFYGELEGTPHTLVRGTSGHVVTNDAGRISAGVFLPNGRLEAAFKAPIPAFPGIVGDRTFASPDKRLYLGKWGPVRKARIPAWSQ